MNGVRGPTAECTPWRGHGRPVIVVFGETNNPPSLRLKREMEEARGQHPDTDFVYIDAHQCPGIFEGHAEGEKVPAVVVFDKFGREIDRQTGKDALHDVLHPEERAERITIEARELRGPAPAEHAGSAVHVSDTFVRDVNGFLKKAGFTPRQARLTAQKDGYEVHEGTSPPQTFTDVTKTVEAINLLVAKLHSTRHFPLFRLNPFWDQPAWLVDIDGRPETTGPEAESMLLTSLNNNRAWTFDYEDKAFQEGAAREAQKIVDQCTFLLSLPTEVLAAIVDEVAPNSHYPLQARLTEYRDALVGLLQDVPRNIAEIHQRIAFSIPEKPDADVEPIKLAYRLSYRYRNLALFDHDLSPEHFATLFSTKVARTEDSKTILLSGVPLHHPASFVLALRPEEKTPAEMTWNLQLLADWLRFLTMRGFEVGLVDDKIVVQSNKVPLMKFFLRDQLLVEQWMDTASKQWQEAVVGEKREARALVTHDAQRPWGLATFKLPDGKKLPPMRILSMIPQMGSRDQHPTNLEQRANENVARWFEGLMVNLADWRSYVPDAERPEKKKQKTSDVHTLSGASDDAAYFAQQLEERTTDWLRQLMEDFRWGKLEVSVLLAQENNLVDGIRLLIGRNPTQEELDGMTGNSMGMGVAGRWGMFSTKHGIQQILWMTTPQIVAHESGHDFFFVSRPIEPLIDNQWHGISLLFPNEADFLGYYKLTQDYFATQRDYRAGGSGNLPSDGGSFTDMGAGNLAAILTSVHGGLSYVFPSAYSLWGDISPYAGSPVVAGQEYAAEMWEQEMNTFTLAGVVYHATDPHEVSEADRHLSAYHQRTIQSPFQEPPENPFTRGAMLGHHVPMDELRLYQTHVEVLESNDPKISYEQRLHTIAHFAPDVLRSGPKSVRAVHLRGPHDATLTKSDSATLDVGAFLLTPEQERFMRAQGYRNFFRSIDLADGEVVVEKQHGTDGARAATDFNFGQTMANADWTGGSVNVDQRPPPPQQQVVRDDRPQMPDHWFPFQQPQAGIVARKANQQLERTTPTDKASTDSQSPPTSANTKPDKPLARYETGPSSPAAAQADKPGEASGFKPWMLLALPLAPLYPVYAAMKAARRKPRESETTFVPTESSEDVAPRMEASAMLCIDPARAAGKTFAIAETTYESILPTLSQFELYHRYDPDMAFELFMQLDQQGIDPDYLLSCLAFPLGESLAAKEEYRRAFELYAWAMRTDQSKNYSAAIQKGFLDIASRILDGGDKGSFQLGWDALERAMGFEPRPPEAVRLAANYLMWRDGANLKPEALFDVIVGINVQERKVAAAAIMEWVFDPDTAVQISALKNAQAWLDEPDAFVRDILQRLRKGFIKGDVLDQFLRALNQNEADTFARLWFEQELKPEEFSLGLRWLLHFASTETIVSALMRGSQFDWARDWLKWLVSGLPQEKREALVNELSSRITWEKGKEETSFQAARAKALFFPDPIEGIDALIDGFLRDAWPGEHHVKGITLDTYGKFMATLGIRSWNDLPSIEHYAGTLIDRSLEREGFPINADRLYELYWCLYGLYVGRRITEANEPNIYFLSAALSGVYFGNESLLGLPDLPSLSNYDAANERFFHVVALTNLRSRLCKLISKLDRVRAEKLAGLVPQPWEVFPDNDPDLKVALVLNSLHEPWDANFPRALLEGSEPYTIGIASRKLVQMMSDHFASQEMRMKAVLILMKWNSVADVGKLVADTGLTAATQRPDWQQWGALIKDSDTLPDDGRF